MADRTIVVYRVAGQPAWLVWPKAYVRLAWAYRRGRTLRAAGAWDWALRPCPR